MDLKNNIRLIGFDLDGTLLNDEKQLCEGALNTLKKAKNAGIQLVPVTGRPLIGVPKCVKELEEIDYIICSNGASIIDARTEEVLCSFSMSNEKSREIFSLLKKSGCVFEPFANGVCYTEQKILDSYIGYFRGSPIEEYLLSTRVICDSLDTLFTRSDIRADEFFVSCDGREQRERVTALLDGAGGVHYWFYDERYIEIMKEGCDKGSAFLTLCSRLNIPAENTMAFGDGDNDVLFLEKAGVSVAMGNAFPSVKEKADIIADTNNNNGVCKLIEIILRDGAYDI